MEFAPIDEFWIRLDGTPFGHGVTHGSQNQSERTRWGLGIGSQAASSIGWGWSSLGTLPVLEAREGAETL